MPTNVVMPQMGESVAEGTITKWLRKVGEHIGRDEPLFEISTDKVDAEIPSPAAGILSQILVKENETVGVNTVVAVIDGEGAGAGAPAPAGAAEEVSAHVRAGFACSRNFSSRQPECRTAFLARSANWLLSL